MSARAARDAGLECPTVVQNYGHTAGTAAPAKGLFRQRKHEEAPMRALSLAAVVALAAAPAFAQDAAKSPQQKPATSAIKPQMSTVSPQTSTVSREAQEKLREALQRAGFQDIRIVDATYVIHARTQDGNFVVMYVNPSGAGAGSATTGKARTETPPAPEAPVLERADERLKYRPEDEKSKADPNKQR